MTPFESIYYQFLNGCSEAFSMAQLFVSRLSNGERILGICLFTAVVILFAMFRKRNYEQGGGMGRQALLAFLLVFLLTSGSIMLFDGFGSLGRSFS